MQECSGSICILDNLVLRTVIICIRKITKLSRSRVTMKMISWPCAFFLFLGGVTAFLFNDGPTSSSPHLSEQSQSPLRIGSMNVQVFGRTKIQRPVVRHWLPKILARYDVVLIQEIRDITGTAFEDLWHLINEELRTQHVNDVYDKVVSGRLGRTSSKEQYGFLFRKSKLQLTDTYQYPDPGDVFEREPFGVRFTAPHTVVDDFAIAAIHTSPSHARDEIGNLTKVYDSMRQQWHLENIIIMGDFNMDCTYVSATEIQESPLHKDPRFMWLIGEEVDTTVRDTTDCTYDRFVLSGALLQHSVTPGSARVFQFDHEWNITKDEALHISDHYPIEFAINGKPYTKL